MSKILLVEDDLMILDTTKELLELLEHQVHEASSGARAMEILAEQGGKFDLVLLDLSLQDMDGSELLPKISAKYPDLKLVICSGSLPDELEFTQLPSVKGILNKPFELRELRETVGTVLEGNPV